MTLISLVLALALEQFRPFNAARFLHQPLVALSRFFEDRFNDGRAAHGVLAWCLMVLPPVILTALLHFFLYTVSPLLAMAFNVAVLYYTFGFRHASHFFTRIHAALRAHELDRARELIGLWRKHLHDRSPSNEVARLTIEEALLGAHRQVFAIFIVFLILPGPSGAVLYRMSEFLSRHWGERKDHEIGEFGQFARKAFYVVEWLPARITAMAFSIVGDFEDAAYCWRTQSTSWSDRNAGILLASGAGALGVRLGGPIHQSGEIVERPELGAGDEADVDFLQSTVGLVRRTVVLYVVVLLFMGISRMAG
ncbi:MAG: CobD/CbiB family protein [Moraxellaceae bacterium]|nr:CobD/CbiB family protein [Moraxellaceae bacterium]